MRTTLLVGVGCVALSAAASAQVSSPVGTWTLNVAKSTYSPGPAPRLATLTVEAAGAAMKTTLDSVAADGSTLHWMYTAAYDGKDVPTGGNNPGADSAARRRLNPSTTETTYKKNGKVTTVNTNVISADGRTLTVTVKGTDAQGRAVNNVQVYDRLP